MSAPPSDYSAIFRCRVTARELDAFLVPTAALAGLVRAFLAAWNRDRPPTGGRFAAGGLTTDVTPVRASEWLSTASGVSEGTIRNICDERYRMTSLGTADAIVSDGLGRPDYLYDGTLAVIARADAGAYLLSLTADEAGISVDDLLAIQALAEAAASAGAVEAIA